MVPGTVYKLSGKRRRPFICRKTIGWFPDKETGRIKQKVITIGYARTREEALKLLFEYNSVPYEVFNSKITFGKVFELLIKEKEETTSHSSYNAYRASYLPFQSLENKLFKDLRHSDFQYVIDNCKKNYPTLRKMKVLLNQMYKYAMKNEFVVRDYSQFININKFKSQNPNAYKEKVFTDREIDKLWLESEDIYVSIILILIYTGVRISELLNLKKEDIHLDEQYFMVKESKTVDGIRRVPIADKVLPFFKFWMSNNCEYLICNRSGRHMIYDVFRDQYWDPIMARYGFDHTPHDTRHTNISLLARRGVSQTIIKKVCGHRHRMSLTEKVYVHFNIKELLDAVNLI